MEPPSICDVQLVVGKPLQPNLGKNNAHGRGASSNFDAKSSPRVDRGGISARNRAPAWSVPASVTLSSWWANLYGRTKIKLRPWSVGVLFFGGLFVLGVFFLSFFFFFVSVVPDHVCCLLLFSLVLLAVFASCFLLFAPCFLLPSFCFCCFCFLLSAFSRFCFLLVAFGFMLSAFCVLFLLSAFCFLLLCVLDRKQERLQQNYCYY